MIFSCLSVCPCFSLYTNFLLSIVARLSLSASRVSVSSFKLFRCSSMDFCSVEVPVAVVQPPA